MKRVITLGIVGAMCLVTRTLATEGIWTTKTSMPTPRMYLSTSVVDGRIYAIGGSTSVTTVVTLGTVEQYDAMTDTWTARSPMPTARWGLSTCTVNGRIYAIGGATAHPAVTQLQMVEEYDPATDTWRIRAPMPTARWGLVTGVVAGKIYAMGGLIPLGPTAGGVSVVEEYDPATDRWTTKAPMNMGRYAPSACAVNGKIYVLGGVTTYPVSTATVEEYDPERDTWTMKGSLPAAKTYFSASEVNGRIYAIGGAPHPDNATALVYEYDPVSGTSMAKPNLLNPRTGLSTSAVGGRVYAIGGSTSGWPWSPSGLVEEYTVRPLVVDFNGDGIVDLHDLVLLIQHWGQADLRFDIGPEPWGDGKVDQADLEVLMRHWGEMPGLIAYWKLDEASGTVAADSGGANAGTLVGSPVWQPTGGKIKGALLFDGQDDVLTTPPVLNPSAGPFTFLAWIKGGAPGQVILAQHNGTNWLMLDPAGRLMTDFRPARSAPLATAAVITDGLWHRVGLSWDGTARILYVDGVEVARDAKAFGSPPASVNGLNLGAGSTLAPGTFWSGLIDDVRIYNRVVQP